MKSFIFWTALALFVVCGGQAGAIDTQGLRPVEGLAPEVNYEHTWRDKLKRAGTNLWSAPQEVKYSLNYAKRTNYNRKSWSWAFLEGVGRGFARWGAGWLEFFTAPFDWPDEFKEPIYLPITVWEREDNPDGEDLPALTQNPAARQEIR